MTGGYVYRGERFPAMRSWYFFGDYCSGAIMLLDSAGRTRPADRGSRWTRTCQISAIGEDADGKIYMVDYGPGKQPSTASPASDADPAGSARPEPRRTHTPGLAPAGPSRSWRRPGPLRHARDHRPDGSPSRRSCGTRSGTTASMLVNSLAGRRWPNNLLRDPRCSMTVEDGYRLRRRSGAWPSASTRARRRRGTSCALAAPVSTGEDLERRHRRVPGRSTASRSCIRPDPCPSLTDARHPMRRPAASPCSPAATAARKLSHGLALASAAREPRHGRSGLDLADRRQHRRRPGAPRAVPCRPTSTRCMYTLAGLANEETGWGVRDETWSRAAMLERLGAPTWFRLGDRDLATHLLRTERAACRAAPDGGDGAASPSALGVRARAAADDRRPGADRAVDGRRLAGVPGVLRAPAPRATP